MTARAGLNCMVGDDFHEARAEFQFNGTSGFSLYKQRKHLSLGILQGLAFR